MKNVEKEIAAYFKRKYCILTGTGTSAIYLILKSFKKRGANVLYPAITCIAPVNAAIYAEMNPLFCDINLTDYTMDIDSMKSIIENNNIHVVVPTHIYGHCCNMDAIIDFCREKEIFILEDAAQALGGTYKGKLLGSFGDASVISFGHTKILDCGGGGAILTDNEELYEAVKLLGDTLQEMPEDIEKRSNAYRIRYYEIIKMIEKDEKFWKLMYELQILSQEILIYKIDKNVENKIYHSFNELKKVIVERNRREELYLRNLNKNNIKLPSKIEGSVCWRFSFLYNGNRRKLLEEVRRNNIDISSWYPAVYRMYSDQNEVLFNNSNIVEESIVNLWVNPEYSIEEIMSNIRTINEIL